MCSSCGHRVKVAAGRGGDSTWGLTDPVGNNNNNNRIIIIIITQNF